MIKTYNIFILHISRRCSLTRAREFVSPQRQRRKLARRLWLGGNIVPNIPYAHTNSYSQTREEPECVGCYSCALLCSALNAFTHTHTQHTRIEIYLYNMRNQFVGIIFRSTRAVLSGSTNHHHTINKARPFTNMPRVRSFVLRCGCLYVCMCALNSVCLLEIITVGQCHGANGEIWTVRSRTGEDTYTVRFTRQGIRND